MDDVIIIVKLLEDSRLLSEGATETLKLAIKNMKVDFFVVW